MLASSDIYKDGIRKKSYDLFRTYTSEAIPYRIPAIAKTIDGSLVAVADYRFCRADIGFGHIDLHCRISNDNGKSWGDTFTIVEGDGKKIDNNPNLSLKDVAKATGLSSKNLSRAINAILEKSFFDLVNGLRVEKSKALLLAKKERGYTLDTIAEECGFNSRFTFNAAFKRATGLTTSEWLKSTKAV